MQYCVCIHCQRVNKFMIFREKGPLVLSSSWRSIEYKQPWQPQQLRHQRQSHRHPTHRALPLPSSLRRLTASTSPTSRPTM